MKAAIHWFRRDLRLKDNHGLYCALDSGLPVIPIFIFDDEILSELEVDDPRVAFIHERLSSIHNELSGVGSGLVVLKGDPITVWKEILETYEIGEVHTNKDYEPYALQRDSEVASLLKGHGIEFHSHKDQVVFERDEVMKDDGTPYTVYTPYSKKWFTLFKPEMIEAKPSYQALEGMFKFDVPPTLPSLDEIGFRPSNIKVQPYRLEKERIAIYDKHRDYPSIDGTSLISPHLRFGTISIREAFKQTYQVNHTYAKELVWREFFMQILFHFPDVVQHNFRRKYDAVKWRNDDSDFATWCEGKTGYPMVDAGMRELNHSGYMHNRVRMVVAGFLCKHLLIDWRWGEAYFAKKLLDYELSSNNGNWQWAAGTGCDAAPYFRVFNPHTQLDRFDKSLDYIRKWIPEFGTSEYPEPMVDHKFARERALSAYKEALN